MMDDDAVHMALRAYGLTAIAANTGVMTLASTLTGFTRADGGSFIDDKFRRGMEIVADGFFGFPMHAVITSVSPTDMRAKPFVINIANGVQSVIYPSVSPLPPAPGRSIVAIMPSMRSLENEPPAGLSTFTPISGIPYIEEEFSPDVTFRVTGSLYTSEGDLFWKFHGVIGAGPSHLRKTLSALKEHYTDAIIPVPNEQYVIRIRGDPAPTTQAIIQTTAGPVLILAVPWEVRSRKVVVHV